MKFAIGFVISLIFFISSLILIVLNNNLYKYIIKHESRLVPGNYLYNNWLNNSADVYMSFYLFNLTNRDEFEKNNNTKPLLEEIGPFVYKETKIKENLKKNNNGTISYTERRLFHFVPKMSPYSNKAIITTINLPTLAIINKIKNDNSYKPIANLAFKSYGETMFVNQPVEKLLFGYENKLINYLHSLNKDYPNGNVSIFYKKNDTVSGNYTIFDGIDDPSKLGVVQFFNGKKNLSYWFSDFANQINGTDLSLNYPFLNESSKLYTFQSDFCRSFYLVHNDTKQLQKDIKILGYTLDDKFYGNTSVNPDNKGFCYPMNNCSVNGVFNLTSCFSFGNVNVPIYLSNPHFLNGDQKLLDDVEGLSPNITKHKAMVYFEQSTSIPMKANKRIQLNAKLIKDEKITIAQNISEIFFPIYWIDENFEFSEQNINDFHQIIINPFNKFKIFEYLLLSISFFAAVLLLSAHYFIKSNKNPSAYTEIGDDEKNLINKLSSSTESLVDKLSTSAENLFAKQTNNETKHLLPIEKSPLLSKKTSKGNEKNNENVSNWKKINIVKRIFRFDKDEENKNIQNAQLNQSPIHNSELKINDFEKNLFLEQVNTDALKIQEEITLKNDIDNEKSLSDVEKNNLDHNNEFKRNGSKFYKKKETHSLEIQLKNKENNTSKNSCFESKINRDKLNEFEKNSDQSDSFLNNHKELRENLQDIIKSIQDEQSLEIKEKTLLNKTKLENFEEIIENIEKDAEIDFNKNIQDEKNEQNFTQLNLNNLDKIDSYQLNNFLNSRLISSAKDQQKINQINKNAFENFSNEDSNPQNFKTSSLNINEPKINYLNIYETPTYSSTDSYNPSRINKLEYFTTTSIQEPRKTSYESNPYFSKLYDSDFSAFTNQQSNSTSNIYNPYSTFENFTQSTESRKNFNQTKIFSNVYETTLSDLIKPNNSYSEMEKTFSVNNYSSNIFTNPENSLLDELLNANNGSIYEQNNNLDEKNNNQSKNFYSKK